ncbi:MAG: hypothetical protein SXG53_00120 [Pseudomonadota bacterium]|nr:hypothetical protein [Pseudomonadota bacterium]
MKPTINRVLAWAVPTLFTAATLTFFLLITLPREDSWSTSHHQLATFVGIALIALIPLGTLVYHLAARRSEDASGSELK